MLSEQEDQAEKLRVTLQDADVQRQQQRQREQGSTFLDQYHSDIGGRFGAIQQESVTGRVSPKPPPLPASSPWSGAQPQPGPEPPLSAYDNPALESSTDLSAVEHLGAPAADRAPPPDCCQPPVTDAVESSAGAPPFSPKGSDDA